MKLAVIALFLGCTAFVCKSAVQSDFLFLQSHALEQFPEVRLTLTRWGVLSIPAPSAPVPPPDSGKNVSPAAPTLAKAEILLLIAESADKYEVPAAFVASVVAAESNFDSTVVSPKGAVGLMQLMPETARQFGADPAIPAQNIEAGTRYLRWLMDRYRKTRNSITHVIAAYNAGPGMVDRYRGVPPFRETRTYVTRVMGFFKQFSRRDNTLSARTARPKRTY
jgi:soluble lytic murein transglycosylase-like protein